MAMAVVINKNCTYPMSHMSLVEIDYQGHAHSIFYSQLLQSIDIRPELSKIS